MDKAVQKFMETFGKYVVKFNEAFPKNDAKMLAEWVAGAKLFEAFDEFLAFHGVEGEARYELNRLMKTFAAGSMGARKVPPGN